MASTKEWSVVNSRDGVLALKKREESQLSFGFSEIDCLCNGDTAYRARPCSITYYKQPTFGAFEPCRASLIDRYSIIFTRSAPEAFGTFVQLAPYEQFICIDVETIEVNGQHIPQVLALCFETAQTVLILQSERAIRDFVRFINSDPQVYQKSKDVVLIGHNIKFDLESLAGFGFSWPFTVLDTMEMDILGKSTLSFLSLVYLGLPLEKSIRTQKNWSEQLDRTSLEYVALDVIIPAQLVTLAQHHIGEEQKLLMELYERYLTKNFEKCEIVNDEDELTKFDPNVLDIFTSRFEDINYEIGKLLANEFSDGLERLIHMLGGVFLSDYHINEHPILSVGQMKTPIFSLSRLKKKFIIEGIRADLETEKITHPLIFSPEDPLINPIRIFCQTAFPLRRTGNVPSLNELEAAILEFGVKASSSGLATLLLRRKFLMSKILSIYRPNQKSKVERIVEPMMPAIDENGSLVLIENPLFFTDLDGLFVNKPMKVVLPFRVVIANSDHIELEHEKNSQSSAEFSLRQDQILASKSLIMNMPSVLIGPPGSGKTLTALHAINLSGAGYAVYLTHNESLRQQVVSEAKKLPKNYQVFEAPTVGSLERILMNKPNDRLLVVTSYSVFANFYRSFSRYEDLFESEFNGQEGRLFPDLLVMDESHLNFHGFCAEIFALIEKIGFKRFLALSATPKFWQGRLPKNINRVYLNPTERVSWAKLQYCPMRQTEQVIVRLFEDFIDASSVSFNGNQTEIKNQIKLDSHLTRNQKNALRCADLVLDLFSHYWSGGVESAVSFFGSRESVGDRRFYCLPKRAKDEINQSLRDDANFRFNLMLQTLLKALNDRPSWQAIIFVEEVFSAVAWEAALTKRGIAVKTYHSDEPERVKNLEAFKVGSLRVLVSTKAGFTGLDIQDKGCIVAFPGFLSSLTDYIQSLGRSRNSCQVLGWPAFGFDKFPNFCRFAREKHNYFLEAVNSCQMRIQETLYGQESIFELF